MEVRDAVLGKASKQVSCSRMRFFFCSCWLFISSSLIWLLGFIARHLFRSSSKRDCSFFEEKEAPRVYFKFQHQISALRNSSEEQLLQHVAAKEEISYTNTSTRNYRFAPVKDLSGFLEEPQVKTFSVQESLSYPDPVSFLDDKNTGFPTSVDDRLPSSKAAELDGTREEEKFPSFETLEKEEPLISKTKLPGKFEFQEFSGFHSDTDSLSASDGYSVKELFVDSDTDGLLSDHEHEVEVTAKKDLVDAPRYKLKLLADIRRLEAAQSKLVHDFDEEFAFEINKFSLVNGNLDDKLRVQNELSKAEEESKQDREFEEPKLLTSDPLTDSSDGGHHGAQKQIISRKNSDEIIFSINVVKPDGTRDEDLDDNNIDSTELNDNALAGLEDFCQQSAGSDQEDAAVMAELDALERGRELDEEDYKHKDDKEKKKADIDDWDHEEASDDEDDSDDELGSLWEHEDLVEQLKNEIRRVRAITLPTIKEESETLKTDDDLKPWKMDEKFLHEEDPMDELHKFYKCYRGRMRKLDILSNQKIHAVGLLQVKDPPPSLGHQKSFVPAITSILSQSFGSCSGKFGINPSEKFIKELQNDLEMVYVGQTCLSWEFLRWQYEKARQLPESDPYRSHQYNQVAGQFQQFQVTLQRFIEDETFQGPRLPNYVKNRCGLQNLLLVPVIREDSLKEKREDQQKGNFVITSETLEDIMEETIRIFWEFVKADKDESSGILKFLMGPRAELQDPSDYEFMAEIYSNLQKKEKKLKDLVRTGNCLVKKFKKPKEDRSNQDLFFSQVDLKLIFRVLRMSRVTTDQLVWCHAKLSSITFMERKVHREPSFLLFPC